MHVAQQGSASTGCLAMVCGQQAVPFTLSVKHGEREGTDSCAILCFGLLQSSMTEVENSQ